MLSIKIGLCLICETIREEQQGKVSMLGFLGVATGIGKTTSIPVAEISLLKADLPLGELAFMFIGSASGSGGPTDLAYEIFDWSDNVVFRHSENQNIKPNERSSFIFNIRLLKFPHAGRHKIRMRVDGRPVYTGEFLIKIGPVS